MFEPIINKSLICKTPMLSRILRGELKNFLIENESFSLIGLATGVGQTHFGLHSYHEKSFQTMSDPPKQTISYVTIVDEEKARKLAR